MLTTYVVSYKDQRKDFLKERKDKISWGYILEIEFHIISSEIDSYLAVLRIRTIQTQVIQSGGTIGQQNAVQREAFQSRGRQTFVRRHKTVRALAQFSNLNFGFLVISNLKFERVHIDLVKVQWQIIKTIDRDRWGKKHISLFYIYLFGILIGAEASMKNSGLWISGASMRLEEASRICQDQDASPT